MATIVTKSTQTSNLQSPGTNAKMLQPNYHAEVHATYDVIASASLTQALANDVWLMSPLPSNAMIRALVLRAGQMDSNGSPTLAYKVGLYYHSNNSLITSGLTADTEMTTANALVSTAQTGLSASTIPNGTELYFINRSLYADRDKRLFELGGLTTDPGGLFSIGIKITTSAATFVASDVRLDILYWLN